MNTNRWYTNGFGLTLNYFKETKILQRLSANVSKLSEQNIVRDQMMFYVTKSTLL